MLSGTVLLRHGVYRHSSVNVKGQGH